MRRSRSHVVVDTDMGDVGGHPFKRVAATDIEKLVIACGVELEDGGTNLKALCPFCPTARGVLAIDREHGRALGWLPSLFERNYLGG